MLKTFGKFLLLLVILFPLAAQAQGDDGRERSMYDDSSSSSYGGGKVTVCYKGDTRLVKANEAAKLIAKGATPGACTPPGVLVITKTTNGVDGTFDFTSTNDNFNKTSITTVGGTNSVVIKLAHGTYNITEKAQRGWSQVSNTCSSVTVTSGATTTCTVVNKADLGSISGATFLDRKGNGKGFNSPLNKRGGITVYLDTNNNGSLDSGETSTVTDFLGNYKFSNLTPNVTYHVREVVPAGYVETYPSSMVFNETLAVGQNKTNDNFANYLPTRGHYWYDVLCEGSDN